MNSFLINNNKECCTGCSSCASACPQKCITMKADEEGFLYPHKNLSLCVNCNLCLYACPHSIVDDKKKNPIKTVAFKHSQNNVRFCSSSGGAFFLFAKSIIDCDGVVYGASFSKDFNRVEHIRVDCIEELKNVMGSKYIQSDTTDIYPKVKEDLLRGKKVLFSGTPCQIQGLKTFLCVEYCNLYCTEVICHGVPSQLFWEKYLDFLIKKNRGEVLHFCFRSKKMLWKKFRIQHNYGGKLIFNSLDDDFYMYCFLRNYNLRPSCYKCEAKNNGPVADITMGDFWGIDKVVSGFGDKLGVSLLIFNTEKGKNLFESFVEDSIYVDVNYNQTITYNSALIDSCNRPKERNDFYKDLSKIKFDKFMKKYRPFSMKRIIKRTVIYKLLSFRKTGGIDYNYKTLIVIDR